MILPIVFYVVTGLQACKRFVYAEDDGDGSDQEKVL
jgi:hypothetical protein